MAETVGTEPGLAAIELNVSCPNVSHGLDLGIDAASVGRLVRRVRAACPLPVIAKLTPNVTDVVAIARAAAEGGADAVSLVNTFRGMAVNWRSRRPILANDAIENTASVHSTANVICSSKQSGPTDCPESGEARIDHVRVADGIEGLDHFRRGQPALHLFAAGVHVAQGERRRLSRRGARPGRACRGPRAPG